MHGAGPALYYINTLEGTYTPKSLLVSKPRSQGSPGEDQPDSKAAGLLTESPQF